MTTIEAYNFAMSKVNELYKGGIEITIKPSKSKDHQATIKKYDKPGHIPPDLWRSIRFKNLDYAQAEKIFDMSKYLGMCGICFDVGGMPHFRDWEFDWSFNYKEGEERSDWIEAQIELRELINGQKND